jgi:hypothetical protein
MPVVVFNATLAETGQRLLISPAVFKPRPAGYIDPAIEFLHLFPDEANLRVSTAVRLSATFPYVSPISRPRCPHVPPGHGDFVKDCHVVDGGYLDNEGAYTAVEWVRDLLVSRHPEGDGKVHYPFDQILFLRIFPFPPDNRQTPRTHGKQGWANELTGPIQALQNVRVASQQERNTFGLTLLKSFRDPSPDFFDVLGEELQDKARDAGLIIPIRDVRFYFYQRPGVEIPLSWQLTPAQRRAIDQAWADLCDDVERDVEHRIDDYNAVATFDNLFARRKPRR